MAIQTLQPDEVEIVRAVRPNGRARNLGVARSQAPILVFVDDDAVLGLSLIHILAIHRALVEQCIFFMPYGSYRAFSRAAFIV